MLSARRHSFDPLFHDLERDLHMGVANAAEDRAMRNKGSSPCGPDGHRRWACRNGNRLIEADFRDG